jgi:secernin
MCDTVVGRASDGSLWLAKNSDREPGEAQVLEHLPRQRRGPRLRCTHIELDDVPETFEVVLSRPAWMWGAEMGVNEHGVAIGNEAVFTRLALETTGLTGMDLLRLALERAATARVAVELIGALLGRHGQGGRMGFRNKGQSYASSFLIVDPREAWVLETAGRVFAATEVAREPGSVRAISNGLTLGGSLDVLGDGALAAALSRGWCKGRSDFDFRRCFSDPVITRLAGAALRSACTTASVARARGQLDLAAMTAALRDHGGPAPGNQLIMSAPCAHAAPWPTRASGQTTASLVAQLGGGLPRVWATGTSSPCLSVFKRVPLGTGTLLQAEPRAQEKSDGESLWWRHERLHRAVLANWQGRAAPVIAEARKLEAHAHDAHDAHDVWERHRAAIPAWLSLARAPGETRTLVDRWYWRRMSRLDGLSR